ncbi:hypothetical protein C477_02424 [Haloterrigena salina JCM 13891]|uniref:Uncharacterized protein n=1 Tax=Haloterrigena salina JCM 13891 TaxID=1227488 RepID=M0CNB7_9EURY|nr:hypothetical protein C477_02424 [Haloterrigena salina JCM 13891]
MAAYYQQSEISVRKGTLASADDRGPAALTPVDSRGRESQFGSAPTKRESRPIGTRPFRWKTGI